MHLAYQVAGRFTDLKGFLRERERLLVLAGLDINENDAGQAIG